MWPGFLKGKAKDSPAPAPAASDAASDGSKFSSHAAAALAAAASSNVVSSKAQGPQPAGRWLAGSDVTIDLDALRPAESITELQVQPITLLKYDYKLDHSRQVAISSSYICYGLKAGHIRALNRNTASRALFKGHSAPLSDVAFFSPERSLLASASRNGDVVVREVSEAAGPDREDVPSEAVLLSAQLDPGGADALVLLAWHPSMPQILAAGAGGSVNIFEVPSAPPAEQPPPRAAPGITYALPAPAAGSPAPAVTSVAFSPAGDLLVAADSAGGVHAWWLEGADEDSAEPLLSWRPFGDTSGAVASTLFLHQAADGASLLLTGDATNAALKLWALPGAAAAAAAGPGGRAPALLQSVHLRASAAGPGDLFCHAVAQRDLQLVVLANTVRRQVYTLHYALGRAAAGAGAAAAAAPASGQLDYCAFFSVKQPILSLTTGLEAVESQAVPGEVQPQQLLLYTVQTDAIQQYVLNPVLCSAGESGGGKGRGQEDGVEEGEEASSSSTTAPAPAASSPGGALPRAPLRGLRPMVCAEEQSASSPPLAGALPAEAAEPAAAAAVPPPAQLPTPGLLLHAGNTAAAAAAGAATHEGAADEAGAAVPAAASVAEAAAPAAVPPPATKEEVAAAATPEAQEEEPPERSGGSDLSQQEAAMAAAVASAAATAPGAGAPLPPMPTTSLMHCAEKAVPAAAPAVPAVAAAGDLAALQQQMQQLLAMQQQLAGQLQAGSRETVAGVKAELGRALKATEASLAKQVEGAIKASSKKAEEERRKAATKERHELEKAIGAQLAQVSAVLQRDLLKALADVAHEQAQSTAAATAGSVSQAVAPAVAAALQRELACGAGGAPGALQGMVERSLASGLARPLHDALRDNFSALIIPAFERATQVMFGQVESAFSSWLADSSRAAGSAQSEAAQGLAASVSQLQSLVATVRGELAETTRSLSRLASSAVGRAEGTSGGGAGALSVSQLEAGGRAAPPPADPRVEIGALLAVRKYDDALTKALNTASLDVLVWTCKQADPAAVLGGSSVGLSQATLLSLVHQLAADLHDDANTPVKLAWLGEAAPAIDPHDPLTEPHIKGVLTGVMSSLKALVNALPQSDAMAKKGKITLHLFNSLLHQ